MRRVLFGMALLGLVACSQDIVESDDPDEPLDTGIDIVPAEAERGDFEAVNASGRHGSYYLPSGYNTGPLPVILAYHGSGGNGASMVGPFERLAEELRFAIVAPDSREMSGGFNWELNVSGTKTPDYIHAMACLDELLDHQDVQLDPDALLAIGFSGGASSAPYVASNEARFTAFAVLHGGVFEQTLGDNIIPGWFSTGQDDNLRTPKHVEEQAAVAADAGFPVEFRVFPGGHMFGPQEADEVILWWLEP